MLTMLRQPRYLALSALMLVVAAACVAAGTWQIVRLHGKAGSNAELRRNARGAAVPIADLLPLVGRPGAPPRALRIQFRRVQVSGTYDPSRQRLVRQRFVDDDSGFLVLSPLRTTSGTLLVVRGFISDRNGSPKAPPIPSPPSGPVTVTVRVEPAETRHDQAGQLPDGQLESINPVDQAARSADPVFDGYAELLPRQPGSAGLTAMPAPDLSNPAGGAIEPQHLAYIVQWYLFALLALAAPVAMVRAETRHHDERELDDAPGAPELPGSAAERERAMRLADRYGRGVRR